jgi:hypothetical protein
VSKDSDQPTNIAQEEGHEENIVWNSDVDAHPLPIMECM